MVSGGRGVVESWGRGLGFQLPILRPCNEVAGCPAFGTVGADALAPRYKSTGACRPMACGLPLLPSYINLSLLAQHFAATDLGSSPIVGRPLGVAPAIEPVHTLPLAHQAFGGIKTVQAR